MLKKRYKNLIVGSGFSASIVKSLIRESSKLISTSDTSNLKFESFIKRKNLESNKFFVKKAPSFGSINFEFKNGIFHDRLAFGGNTDIWGGHINTKKISKKILRFFAKKKVIFKKLSYSNTGTISNNNNIHQMQELDGRIINSSYLINQRVDNFYVINFFIKKKKIFLNVLNLEKLKNESIETNKLFLCIGSIQLIDLLFRSNYLKENDIIEFFEYKHKFLLTQKKSKFIKKAVTVRYSLSRAIGHYTGVQSFVAVFKIFNFIPICIDQIFYKLKDNYKLILKGNKLTENRSSQNSKNFGSSIHYCNMKINGVEISKYLKKINKNLIGFGMSFVNQDIPGPISNDIIIDINKKLTQMKLIKKI